MAKIKLIKLKEVEDATHPNNIKEGYEYIGDFRFYPKLGQEFYVGHSYSTSIVREIISFDTFKTLNSIYKIIPLED